MIFNSQYISMDELVISIGHKELKGVETLDFPDIIMEEEEIASSMTFVFPIRDIIGEGPNEKTPSLLFPTFMGYQENNLILFYLNLLFYVIYYNILYA